MFVLKRTTMFKNLAECRHYKFPRFWFLVFYSIDLLFSSGLPQLSSKLSFDKKPKQVLQNLPSNLPSHQPDLKNHCTDENDLKDICTQTNFQENSQYCRPTERKDLFAQSGLVQENNISGGSLLRECSCDFIVCCCHNSPRGLWVWLFLFSISHMIHIRLLLKYKQLNRETWCLLFCT